MRHRLKNSYALVYAIAGQTARHETTQEAFLATFAARLAALARTNDLLVGTGREDVALADLVNAILAPYSGEPRQVTVDGIDVTLRAALVTMVGLTLHELATNAAKYGSLSSPSGSVSVRWTIDRDAHRIEIMWRERGGPPVRPPASHGFGTRLLTRGLSQGIATRMDFAPEGLECAITLPLDNAEEAHSVPSPLPAPHEEVV